MCWNVITDLCAVYSTALLRALYVKPGRRVITYANSVIALFSIRRKARWKTFCSDGSWCIFGAPSYHRDLAGVLLIPEFSFK